MLKHKLNCMKHRSQCREWFSQCWHFVMLHLFLLHTFFPPERQSNALPGSTCMLWNRSSLLQSLDDLYQQGLFAKLFVSFLIGFTAVDYLLLLSLIIIGKTFCTQQAGGFCRMIVGERWSPEPTIKLERNREQAVQLFHLLIILLYFTFQQ